MKVFIASSTEALALAREIAAWLSEEGVEPVLWQDPDVFRPGEYTYESLVRISQEVQGAVLLMTGDDKIWYRKELKTQPRDNIFIEYGLFSAILGLKRAIILVSGDIKQSSDLVGINHIDMSALKKHRARLQMSEWCKSVRYSPSEWKKRYLSAGIREAYPKDQSPLRNIQQLRSLVQNAKEISFAGTGLSGLYAAFKDCELASALSKRICEGDLKLTILFFDPSGSSYLKLRADEIDQPGFDTLNSWAGSYSQFTTFKSKLLESNRNNYSVFATIQKSLFVGTYKTIPRGGIFKFDKRLFVRFYNGINHGDDAPFILELEPESSAYKTYEEELARIRRVAEHHMIPIRISDAGDAVPEHREIVHQCRLVHDTVHFLCLDSNGHFYLQRRSNQAGRNPGCWTSTVSGHVEVQDGGMHERALEREIEEELGKQALDSIKNIEYIGAVDCVSSGKVRIGKYLHEHVCNGLAHVYVGRSELLPWIRTREIEEVAVFERAALEEALKNGRSLKSHPMANNFSSVYSYYNDWDSVPTKG